MAKHGGKREGAGKPKGAPAKVTASIRKEIEDADPIGFLIKAMKGECVGGEVLKYKERADCAQFLAKKIVPDLKSVEMIGENGGDILIRMINYGDKDGTN